MQSDKPDSNHNHLAAALEALEDDPNAIPWPDRRELARSLGELLTKREEMDVVISLARLLADDPKWEVRMDIANLLLLLPGNEFLHLSAKLSNDNTSFVSKAADRALGRYQRGQRDARRKRYGIEQFLEQFDLMEKLHGTVAARQARKLGEQLFNLYVAGPVHNMRGILTPVKASQNTLLKRLEGGSLNDDALRTHLEKIGGHIEFLERLLNDMRRFSQPTVADRRAKRRLVDMFDEARKLVAANLEAEGRDVSDIELRVSIPESIVITAVHHQIVIVLKNVLKNAFEVFLLQGEDADEPVVEVTTETSEEDVSISVRDNGIGLDEIDVNEIRAFVPGLTTKKLEGTGFGLPTAKRYIENHGGEISFQSNLGSGSTVTITLPFDYQPDSDQ